MVSILIPVYNRDQYIAQTIESALNQTHANIEVIIVDNCSADDTWKIIQAYAEKDNRIKIFQNDSNIGPVRNWKRCIDEASGEYGKILWSDDLIAPDFIEKTLPFLQKNDDVGFVFTGTELFFDDGGRKPIRFIRETGIYSSREYIEGVLIGQDYPVSPGCAVFRLKDLRKNLMIQVPNKIKSDFSMHAVGNDVLIFLLTASQYKHFAFINENLSFFRSHKSSISVASDRVELESLYDAAKAYFVENYLDDIKLIKKFNSNVLDLKKILKKYLSLRSMKDNYFFYSNHNFFSIICLALNFFRKFVEDFCRWIKRFLFKKCPTKRKNIHMGNMGKIPPRDEWRNRRTVIKEFIRNPRLGLWLWRDKYQVFEFYNNIAKTDPFVYDPDVPQWLNFGYWKNETTFNGACAALARKLGKVAELKTGDKVLDVGFGFADQDLLWARENNVDSIVGLNITKLHVEIARRRVVRAGLTEKIHLQVGSATEIPFPENSFDKVMALECAFHFNTREDFFAEAFRVLRPGGRLALADCLPKAGRKIDFWMKMNSKKICIPFANQYDRYAYVEKLKKHGFVNIQTHSINEYVWPAMVHYFDQVIHGAADKRDIVIDLQKDNPGIEAWSKNKGWFIGFDDYLLFSGEKPLRKF